MPFIVEVSGNENSFDFSISDSLSFSVLLGFNIPSIITPSLSHFFSIFFLSAKVRIDLLSQYIIMRK
nr:MAG TPA: hypothetical protein [Caudoviricetes sp.]